MNLSISELKIIERLLKNRLNADYEIEIDDLHNKIKMELERKRYNKETAEEWVNRNIF